MQQVDRMGLLIAQHIDIHTALRWTVSPGVNNNPTYKQQDLYLDYKIDGLRKGLDTFELNQAMLKVVQYPELYDKYKKNALQALSEGRIESKLSKDNHEARTGNLAHRAIDFAQGYIFS